MSEQRRQSEPRLLIELLSQSTGSPPKATTSKQPAAQPSGVESVGGHRSAQSRSVEDPEARKKKLEFLRSAHEAVLKDQNLSKELNVSECHCSSTGEDLLTVTTKAVFHHEPALYVSRFKLVLTGDGNYNMQVLLKVVDKGTVHTLDDFKELCYKMVFPSGMKFCPGIPLDEYEGYKKVIKYDQKRVHITEEPYKRIASENCLMWVYPTRNMSKVQKMSLEVLCKECVHLTNRLKHGVKRLSQVSAERQLEREQPSSSYPLMYLSPESRKRRKLNAKKQQIKERRLINKKSKSDKVALNDLKQQIMQTTIEEVVGSVSTEPVSLEDDQKS